MSYRIRPQTSLETLVDYSVQVRAGLLAVAALKPLADPWLAKRKELQGQRDARDEVRFAQIEARVVARVRDAELDDAVQATSTMSHALSDADAKKSPYADLFGTVKAKQLVKLGAAEAAVAGDGLVGKLDALAKAFPLLDPFVVRVRQAGEALRRAGETRDTADDAAELQGLARKQAVRGVESLIATTELSILTAFAGRGDLVRAVLAPEKPGDGPEKAEVDGRDEPASAPQDERPA